MDREREKEETVGERASDTGQESFPLSVLLFHFVVCLLFLLIPLYCISLCPSHFLEGSSAHFIVKYCEIWNMCAIFHPSCADKCDLFSIYSNMSVCYRFAAVHRLQFWAGRVYSCRMWSQLTFHRTHPASLPCWYTHTHTLTHTHTVYIQYLHLRNSLFDFGQSDSTGLKHFLYVSDVRSRKM